MDTSRELNKFEKIAERKREFAARRPNEQLLDFGVAEPRHDPSPKIIDELVRASRLPAVARYAENGDERLPAAASHYLRQVFRVACPETQIVHSMGIKAALGIMAVALLRPGDVVLSTIPCYPTMITFAGYLGAEVYGLPISDENSFIPHLEHIPQSILKRSKILSLNYPNSPTGASADLQFFLRAARLCDEHQICLVHDAAYGPLTYGCDPISVLQVPEAMHCAIELHSASKIFDAPGLRCGFVAGAQEYVNLYAIAKTNVDSGQYLPIQYAAAYGFEHPELIASIKSRYERRLRLLGETLERSEIRFHEPRGGMFIYARSPSAVKVSNTWREMRNGLAFSEFLIEEFGVCVVPWDEAGSYVRFSATFDHPGLSEQSVCAELESRLSQCDFKYSD